MHTYFVPGAPMLYPTGYSLGPVTEDQRRALEKLGMVENTKDPSIVRLTSLEPIDPRPDLGLNWHTYTPVLWFPRHFARERMTTMQERNNLLGW